MEHKTCLFIGHHDAPESLAPLIYEAVERHITGTLTFSPYTPSEK